MNITDITTLELLSKNLVSKIALYKDLQFEPEIKNDLSIHESNITRIVYDNTYINNKLILFYKSYELMLVTANDGNLYLKRNNDTIKAVCNRDRATDEIIQLLKGL